MHQILQARCLCLRDDTICGDVPPFTTETISAGTLDNVIVPAPFFADPLFPISGNCQLEGSVVVLGNVINEGGTSFRAIGITINGNVETSISCCSGLEIILDDTTVGGNVDTEDIDLVIRNSNIAGNIHGNARVKELVNNQVGGDIQIIRSGSDILVKDNNIGGNVEVKNNRASSIIIEDNVITGNLSCSENSGLVTSIGNVADNFEGQCLA